MGDAIAAATLDPLVDDVTERVVEWRRYLHKNPEVSFHEEDTARFVRETLESFGNLEISSPTQNSVLARLVADRPGRTIALVMKMLGGGRRLEAHARSRRAAVPAALCGRQGRRCADE